MTSLKDYTVVTIPVTPDVFGTSIQAEEKREKAWKIDVVAKSLVYTYSIGAILSSSLLTIAILFYMVFMVSLVYPIPLISTKFALFISLFSGALGIETLIAKKIKK